MAYCRAICGKDGTWWIGTGHRSHTVAPDGQVTFYWDHGRGEYGSEVLVGRKEQCFWEEIRQIALDRAQAEIQQAAAKTLVREKFGI